MLEALKIDTRIVLDLLAEVLEVAVVLSNEGIEEKYLIINSSWLARVASS